MFSQWFILLGVSPFRNLPQVYINYSGGSTVVNWFRDELAVRMYSLLRREVPVCRVLGGASQREHCIDLHDHNTIMLWFRVHLPMHVKDRFCSVVIWIGWLRWQLEWFMRNEWDSRAFSQVHKSVQLLNWCFAALDNAVRVLCPPVKAWLPCAEHLVHHQIERTHVDEPVLLRGVVRVAVVEVMVASVWKPANLHIKNNRGCNTLQTTQLFFGCDKSVQPLFL